MLIKFTLHYTAFPEKLQIERMVLVGFISGLARILTMGFILL